MMAVGGQEELTAGTLEGLEVRLRKLEYLVTGRTDATEKAGAGDEAGTTTVHARLEQLENALQQLGSKTPAVAELLALYKSHPSLFAPSTSASFTTREQLATINASATSFSATASQLSSIKDTDIPPAEQSAALVALQPRLAAAEQKQARQNQELAQLRLRSARLLERWYDGTVIGGNECWAEWDQTLTKVERTVRREEARRGRESGPI